MTPRRSKPLTEWHPLQVEGGVGVSFAIFDPNGNYIRPFDEIEKTLRTVPQMVDFLNLFEVYLAEQVNAGSKPAARDLKLLRALFRRMGAHS